ncbi:hypothetical protein ES702_07164 [subsurface metagenome]
MKLYWLQRIYDKLVSGVSVVEKTPISGFATSAKQLANDHDVKVSNPISGFATSAKQLANDHDVNVSNQISGYATSAKQLADGHNVAINNEPTIVQKEKDRTVIGTVTAKRGQMDYTTIHKDVVIAGDDVDIPVWTPAGGKKIVLTDVIVSANGTEKVEIGCVEGVLFHLHLSANLPVVIRLESHYTFGFADDDLLITGYLANAEEVTINAYGYEI